MRIRKPSRTLLLLAALAFVPLASDGGQAECCNMTTSLVSTAVGPVDGDESFFKLPTGPANVMLLLDVSGSMLDLPACPSGWGDTASCRTPQLAVPTTNYAPGTKFVYRGMCTPSAYTSPSGDASPLKWMERVVPQTALADPGRTNALLTDRPPWGDGCVGNACLFDPDAYYTYMGPNGSYGWWASDSGSGAYRRASDTDGALPPGCTALNADGSPMRDYDGNYIRLGSDCTQCMNEHGFFFYRVSIVTTRNASGVPTGWSSINTRLMFKGTFLNAYPPKFVAARKVIKDLAWMDPDRPGNMDKVRLGLTILNSSTSSPRKADLIVPLGPDRTSAYPPTQEGFAQARQYILSVLNYDQTLYRNASGTVICDGTTIPTSPSSARAFFNPTRSWTPLGSALFNVGQYFGSLNRYQTLFGSSTYQTSAFNETSAGMVNAPWAASQPCSICWACQNNAVVVVTDGMPNSEISFPSAITGYDTAGYSAAANCGAPGGCDSAALPRVADYLHNADLRDNAVMSGRQALQIHTIGLGVTDTVAVNVLRATANLGGGLYQSADDPASLAAAVVNAISTVIPKENTFSAASATSLQTVETATAHAFVTRFKPSQTLTWEGHVFPVYLFEEALNGCVSGAATQPTVTCQGRTVSADFNGDGHCSGVFMVDSDCDEVSEDPQTGLFMKKGQGLTAVLPWDAGEVLSTPTKAGYRSADESASSARNIFTYVDGVKTAVTAANASTLLPYLNIGAGWCTTFLTRIGVAADSNPTLQCAQNLIHFVRGWDVLDQDADSCKGPGQTNALSCPSGVKGEERDRRNDGSSTPFFWKLGDIFHSSPAVVQVPAAEGKCSFGLVKQCIPTLFSPLLLPDQTPIEMYPGTGGTQIDAYTKYRNTWLTTRKRVLLVGANDGMLHAFDAGGPDTTQSPDPYGDYPYSIGTGQELWAFIPPDLLPRLKDLVQSHQYMVDGSVMLRDVWVDGSGSGGPNRTKEADEYHTVAIFGRRSGGSAFSALDVTDPTSPRLLWNFPQGCTDDARYMGESWAEFAPRPPPIGPVRIANPADPARGFDERWVVMINGGYDPMLIKGRAVFMLDVWTGATLWRFTNDDFRAQTGYGLGTAMFPVTAAIAMVDTGKAAEPNEQGDGFFDSATWGDLGGNLFVARFMAPGVVDSGTHRVTNWYAARTFEQRRRTDDMQYALNRTEFFHMTANTVTTEGDKVKLRSFLGSGNREQMMTQGTSSTTAPLCGTDNLLGCCQMGCTSVMATNAESYGAWSGTSTFACVNGQYGYQATNLTALTPTAATCNADNYTSALNLDWTCPPVGTLTPVTGSASCEGSGLCSVTPMSKVSINPGAGSFPNAQPHNRFYGIWAYGGDVSKRFESRATALTFDRNRFTDDTYSNSCVGPAGGACKLVDVTTYNPTTSTCGTGVPRCTASTSDPGWFYEYGNVCPLSSGTCPSAAPWTDEKTSSGADVLLGCTLFTSFRPIGSSGSTDPCSGSLGVPATYAYRVSYMTGNPDVGMCNTSTLATQKPSTSPPTPSIPLVMLTPSGGSSINALNLDPGAPPSNEEIATRPSATEPIYWLSVPLELHGCRHTTSGAASCK